MRCHIVKSIRKDLKKRNIAGSILSDVSSFVNSFGNSLIRRRIRKSLNSLSMRRALLIPEADSEEPDDDVNQPIGIVARRSMKNHDLAYARATCK
jgi:hypothetical protein